MEEHGDCTSGGCPGASENGETVSIYVDHNHPLLQLKRALPWDALFEVMRRHWRQAGKNTDGRPGLSWALSLYVPLIVLMLVKKQLQGNLSRKDFVPIRGSTGHMPR